MRIRRRCYGRAMTAPSDMGGRAEYFGPVVHEPDEPVFHEPWEGRVFGITFFVGTLLGREHRRRPLRDGEAPARDLHVELLPALARRPREAACRGRASDTGRDRGPTAADPRRPGAPRLAARLAATSRGVRSCAPRLPRWLAAHVVPTLIGRRARRSAAGASRSGDRVRVRGTARAIHATARVCHRQARRRHRAPRRDAASRRPRGRQARTAAAPVHGRLRGRDLWGEAAEPGTEVRVDLYEPYLEAA